MAGTTKPRVTTPSQIGIITKYSFLNYLRSRRFLVMVAIVVIINGALTAAVAYTRSSAFLFSVDAFYGAWWGGFISIFLILTVIFFGGDAISGEFQNKTGYFLVPFPVRRSTIYVGKYLAALVASSSIFLLFFIITLVNGLYYFGADVPSIFLESAVLAWLVMVAGLSFTFMFSSLFKSSSISILITVIMILFVFNIVQALLTSLLNIEPWMLLSYGVQIVGDVLSVPYPPHYSLFTGWNPTIPEGLAILGAYFLACAVLGLVFFERKDFT